MANLTDVHNLARAIVKEPSPPEVFTDAYLLTFSPSVYREIQRRMSAAGVPNLKDYAEFNVASASTIVAITDGSVGYPATVIKPIKLWERLQASSLFSDYVEMEESDPELIPRAQLATLSHWEWKNKTLYFIGASANRTVRMQFAKYLADLTALSDVLAIPDSLDAMAYGTVAVAARSRGATQQAADAESVFSAMVDLMIAKDPGRATGA